MATTKTEKVKIMVTYKIKYKNDKEREAMIKECKDLVRNNANWKGIADVTNATYFGTWKKPNAKVQT